MPEALLTEVSPEQGFHGSLARSYRPFNHERHCLKRSMITSMNEYNSKVIRLNFDWEYFSRHSVF